MKARKKGNGLRSGGGNSQQEILSAGYGIVPGPKLHLPAIECLMVKELVPGTLERIRGNVDYSMYKTLT